MAPPQNEPNLTAFAFGWVSRMTTVVLEMVLPGLGGQWLDSRWGTSYWTLVGFGIGFTVGLIHLMQMVKQYSPKPPSQDNQPPQNNN